MRLNPTGCSCLIVTLAAPIAAAQRPVLDLTGPPSAQLGTAFSAVSHGVELESGAFVFVDRAELLIRSADLTRGTLTSLGRVGSGPREYRRPVLAIADGQGGALIPEETDYRVLRVLPTGDLTASDLPLVAARIRALWIRGVDRQGRILHWGPVNRGTRGAIPIHRWDPATGESTLLGTWPTTTAIVGAPRRTPQGVAREIMSPTLWPLRATWTALPDGTIAIVHPRPYHVEIIRPDGKKIDGPPVAYQPVRVSAALRAAVRAERPVPDDQFPAELPPFEGFDDTIASPAGEVWVGRMQDPADPDTRYDIFGADGVRIGEARLRKHAKVVGFGVGTVYVARQNPEDDLWVLERYGRR